MKREVVESLLISIFTAYLFFYSFYTNVFVIFSNIYYPSIYQFLFFIIPYVALPLLVFFRKNSIIDRIYLYFYLLAL